MHLYCLTERGRSSNPQHEDQSKYESEHKLIWCYWRQNEWWLCGSNTFINLFQQTKGLSKSGLKSLLIHRVGSCVHGLTRFIIIYISLILCIMQSHNEDEILQRGGSMSHRRVQSDSLQNRLPITQHFGKVRFYLFRHQVQNFLNESIRLNSLPFVRHDPAGRFSETKKAQRILKLHGRGEAAELYKFNQDL